MKAIKIFVVMTLILLTSCTSLPQDIVEDVETKEVETLDVENVVTEQIVGRVGDETPLTKGEMARIIALSLYDYDTIHKLAKENDVVIKNLKNDDEVYKYVATLLSQNIITIDNNEFFANEEITLKELQNILKAVNPESSFTLKIDEKTKDLNISYGFFTEIITKTLNDLAKDEIYKTFNLTIANEVVLATSKENNEIPENYIITDHGVSKTSFLNYSSFLNHSIKILKREDEIIFVTEVVSSTPTIYSAYILENSPTEISIFTGGVNRIYEVENGIEEDLAGNLCNIRIEGNYALEVIILGNEITDEIKLVESSNILFKEEGLLPLENNLTTLKFYDITGKTPKYKNSDVVFVGCENIKFVLSDNKIVGGVVFKENDYSNVRVLINDSNFASTRFQEVSFSGSLNVDGESHTNYTVKSEDLQDYEIVTINSENDDEIYFNSITRNVTGSVPKYSGYFDVIKTPYGLVVVNDISIEKYLEKVVPSEMPSTYNMEALKAQAVSARTYAIKQINDKIFQEYGASIDDSVLSQVYNNIDTTENTSNAVNETFGEVLTYNGEVISTNFFSTSSGFTSNSGEVWGNAKKQAFPIQSPEYLTSQNLFYDKVTYDLQNEEDLLNYFKDTTLKAIDSDVSWFRWNVAIDYNTIENNINNFIPNRFKVTPYLISVDEEFLNSNSFGNIKYINVKKRGENGLITELEIIGEKHTLIVKGEYNIRKVLAPINATLTRLDNSIINSYSILPSGFFAFEKMTNGIKIYGGGNGHGVGLSQNGANSLGKNGENYKDILSSFYKNTELVNINK